MASWLPDRSPLLFAGDKRILANLVRSQRDEHRPYGGVVRRLPRVPTSKP